MIICNYKKETLQSIAHNILQLTYFKMAEERLTLYFYFAARQLIFLYYKNYLL